MKVTVYSTTTCATCYLVTNWLNSHKVSYIKKNTDEDPAFMAEFMGINDGFVAVPFTVITNDVGDVSKITGFDQGELKAALKI